MPGIGSAFAEKTVLSGARQDPSNLWPQSRLGGWSADRMDALEATLCRSEILVTIR
jgi:hypothetical protein